MGLKILKTGSFTPCNIVENEYFERYLDTTDDWIRRRTGIKRRRISTDSDLRDMVFKAVEKMQIKREVLDRVKIVIVSTLSADYIVPSISASIVGHLKLHENTFSFDMNMACTGFVGASIIAEKYLKNGELAIVVGGEVLSKYIDFNNRNTAILFGDGVGCVLYQKTDEAFYEDSGSIFSHDLYLTSCSKDKKESYIEMEGKNVYRFAMEKVPESIARLIEKSSYSQDEIDLFVLHQANIRILEGISKRFGNIEKFYFNLDEYGNTSSASIPICLDEMYRKDMIREGSKIILSGFGGGLTYASCIVSGGEI